MRASAKKGFLMALAVLLLGTAALFLVGSTDDMVTVHYAVESPAVDTPIRLALVTDLHSCDYGESQEDLLDAIAAQSPHAVLLGGDIIDDDIPREKGELFVTEVSKGCPTYYVSGNHEYRTDDIEGIKAFIRSAGAAVLEGDCLPLTVDGQTIQVCGVDDPEGVGQEAMTDQLAQAAAQADPALFTILLSHRPELIDRYRSYGTFDLILSGHAHGGQWRIPGLLNGLLAPNQGFFPKYAGGRYDFPDCTFLVSRGLARESTRIPRLFNSPELVIIDIT
ncbi:MAG: metallophosphoesterase [Ruminiclostridium sp.]|nr:metallophosphoesterase [Ruminiclostridium sp.]